MPTDNRKVRILRLSRQSALITGGDVFERNFLECLSFNCLPESVSQLEWLEKVLGPLDEAFPMEKAIQAFATSVESFDFLSPSYELNTMVPFLMYLRNKSKAKVKLLMIAHSPGIYLLEWALLRAVMVPGDWIVAPSNNAKSLITALCPDLSAFIKVIPHPIPSEASPKASSTPQKTPLFVSLARINEDKLLHRQIEAIALIRDWGHPVPQFQIAGSLGPPGTKSLYVRSLEAKIERLGLEDYIHFLGPINDTEKKAAWLAGADLLINMSVTIEESFGKAPAEALTLGVPVLVTQWNGLPETIGAGGICVKVTLSSDLLPDVDPVEVARAMLTMIERPPSPEICLREARRFDPRTVAKAYDELFHLGLELQNETNNLPDPLRNFESLAPTRGILQDWVVLKVFSVAQIYRLHLNHIGHLRQVLAGNLKVPQNLEMQMRVVLLRGSLYPLACFLSGNPMPTTAEGDQVLTEALSWNLDRPMDVSMMIARLSQAAALAGDSSSRVSCLHFLLEVRSWEALERGLEAIEKAGVDGPGFLYLKVESVAAKNQFEKAYRWCSDRLELEKLRETQATQVRQIARICRLWGKPERALAWLKQWLAKYPDSPESGAMWLALCVTASKCGEPFAECAFEAFSRAKRLLGPGPVIEKVQKSLKIPPTLHPS